MTIQTNVIYCGDNKEIMAGLPEKSVDLIYADPPFFSNKNYEVIWNDGAEIRAFEDRWKGGISHYIGWMRPRLQECHRVLKDTGSMYLHCDWHANAYLRILMDKIFGVSNFRNEIIWCYKGGNATRRFRQKHDTIFLYSKTATYYFNADATRIAYSSKLLATTEVDENGRRFYRTGQNESGKIYLHPLGQLPYDWWEDIPSSTMAHGKELIGYPTQKPEALLKRIIGASSNKLDVALDPFCGCGTTIAVAHQLGRQWVGIDVSPTACRMMKDRLVKIGATVTLENMPVTIDELKNMEHFPFQDWVIHKIGGTPQSKKTDDKGIDGWTFMEHKPVQIKQQENVGRNPIDNFETATRRAGYKEGFFYAFSFTKDAYEEVARAKTEDGLNIKLLCIEEII